jgi:hypothetical protein
MNITSRRNRFGQWFLIMVVSTGETRIAHDGNHIFTSMTFNEVLDAWSEWTMGGKLIQEAFPKLSVIQREFIMTAGAFDEIFNSDEPTAEEAN